MGGDKMSNLKFEIAKAKILFFSGNEEEKQDGLKIFADIFHNPGNELKYRIEALGFLLENYYTLDNAYDQLIRILVNEEHDELKMLIILRKIREIGKQEELKKWVMQEILNNPQITPNKRYLIIKSVLEMLNIESELLEFIKEKQLDFFNVILLLKDNRKISDLVIEKLDNSSWIEKLVYLNVLYTIGYNVEEILNNLVSQNIDGCFLGLIFSYYFNDLKIFDKIVQNIENINHGFLNIIFHYFLFSLQNKVPLLYPLESVKFKEGDIFYSILYAVLTKDKEIIRSIIKEISNNYQGLYLAILGRYLTKLGLAENTELNFYSELSEIESEYISTEDAMIEINSSKFSKSVTEISSKEEYDEILRKEEIVETSMKEDKEFSEGKEELHEEVEEIFQEVSEIIESVVQEKVDEKLIEEEKKEEKTQQESKKLETEKEEEKMYDILDNHIKEYFEGKQSELDKNIFYQSFEENKDKFFEIVEKYVFDDSYIEDNFDKILEILKIYKEVNEISGTLAVKALILSLLTSQSFENLAKLINYFNITTKTNFNTYISGNELIKWNEDLQQKLLAFINYISKRSDLISKENMGMFCFYVIEGPFAYIKDSVIKIIEEAFS